MIRPNVCAVILNDQYRVLLAERTNGGWQFPQGGIDAHETPTAALYREVQEEVGLRKAHMELLGRADSPFRYDLPKEYQILNKSTGSMIVAQDQWWYLLKMVVNDSTINLNTTTRPEFKQWRWVSFWYPLYCVIDFKKDVYRQGLTALANLLRDGT